MKKSIILTARNEGKYSESSAKNFHLHFPDAEIIGVDDGGLNSWPNFVRVIKTKSGVGVGRCRLEGVRQATGDVVIVSDAHVYYDKGDIDRAWGIAAGDKIVTSTTVSLFTGKSHGCGRTHDMLTHGAKYANAKDGQEAGLIGGVYFMSRKMALEVIAPTPSHGFNEQIMTYAALSLGYGIYCMPDFAFKHMYKKKFNYSVTSSGQQRNRSLLLWWFFGFPQTPKADKAELDYYKFIQANRILSPKQLTERMQSINDKLKNNGSN
jgi:glycosyltransferase involved in cell wall biosynthesis